MLDSDAAKKICQYELLPEFLQALGCEVTSLAVLPQLKYQLKVKDDAKVLSRLGTIEAVTQIRQLVAAAHEVEVSVDMAIPVLELSGPDIDSGEAVLFAAMLTEAESRLISGDKRAYIALSKIDGEPVDPLWARLLCFEEAIHIMIENVDFEQVSNKVRARLDVDTAMANAFGRSEASSCDSVVDALKSYISALAKDTGGKYQFCAD